MTSITIDGIKQVFEDGITILEAAQQLGVEIPTFCSHPLLKPVAACRVCLVEIEGQRRLQPSCATPITEDMVVNTTNQQVVDAQQSILELLLTNHPLDCPVCDKGGECELQDNVLSRGPRVSHFNDEKRVFGDRDQPLNQVIIANFNRCIQCTRCVRVCDEIVGDQSLGIIGRGDDCMETGFMNSLDSCDHCGNCIEVCPVGALMRKPYRYKARQWDLDKVRTTCPHCGTGCQITADVRNGELTRVRAEEDNKLNHQLLCAKGRFGIDFVDSPHRLTHPMVRKNGQLEVVCWSEAINYIRNRYVEVQKQNEWVAGVISPRSTNEVLYSFQKLFREVFQSDLIDSSAFWFGDSSTQSQLYSVLRELVDSHYTRKPLAELLKADTLFIIGCNTTEDNPVSEYLIRQAFGIHPFNLLIASSRPSRLDLLATTYSRIFPGDELFLFTLILTKLLDMQSDESTTCNSIPEAAIKIQLDRFKHKVNYQEIDIQASKLAQQLIASKEVTLMIGSELLKSPSSGATMVAISHLIKLLETYQVTVNLQFLFEHCNQLGAWDMGATPYWLPGYRRFETTQESLGSSCNWLDLIPNKQGILYVINEDIMLQIPEKEKMGTELSKLNMLIVQGAFETETALFADVLLPSFSFAETKGTFTNNEGRIQQVLPFYSVRGVAKYGAEIFNNIAKTFDHDLNSGSFQSIFSEICHINPIYKNIDEDTLSSGEAFGVNAVSLDEQHSFGETLVVTQIPEATTENNEAPFHLVLGRSVFHSVAQTEQSPTLSSIEPDPYIEINPADAKALGVTEAEMVDLGISDKHYKLKIKIKPRMLEKLLVLSGNYQKLEINCMLTAGNYPIPVTLTNVNAGEYINRNINTNPSAHKT